MPWVVRPGSVQVEMAGGGGFERAVIGPRAALAAGDGEARPTGQVGVDRALVVDRAGVGIDVGVVDITFPTIKVIPDAIVSLPPEPVRLIEPSVNATVPVPPSVCVPLKFRLPPLSSLTVPLESASPEPVTFSASFRM